MGVAAWAIPVGTLAGLCVAALIFIWWWFPRTWKKGTQQELEIIAQEAKRRKLERGENPEDGDAENAEGAYAPKKTFIYTPPPVATF